MLPQFFEAFLMPISFSISVHLKKALHTQTYERQRAIISNLNPLHRRTRSVAKGFLGGIERSDLPPKRGDSQERRGTLLCAPRVVGKDNLKTSTTFSSFCRYKESATRSAAGHKPLPYSIQMQLVRSRIICVS